MSERVFMSSAGLAISASGDNASRPTMPLLFDSAAAPYNGVALRGHVLATDTAWTSTEVGISDGRQYTRTYVVPFNKTFAAAPRTYVNIIDPNSGSGTQNYNFATFGGTVGGTGITSGIGITVVTEVTTTNLTITLGEDAYGASVTAENQARINVDFAYIVFTV